MLQGGFCVYYLSIYYKILQDSNLQNALNMVNISMDYIYDNRWD